MSLKTRRFKTGSMARTPRATGFDHALLGGSKNGKTSSRKGRLAPSEAAWQSSENRAAEEFLVRSRSLGSPYEIAIGQASVSRQREDGIACCGGELILANFERHTVPVRRESPPPFGIHRPVYPPMRLRLHSADTPRAKVESRVRLFHRPSCFLPAACLDLVRPAILG
jgi:hypothetical protein